MNDAWTDRCNERSAIGSLLMVNNGGFTTGEPVRGSVLVILYSDDIDATKRKVEKAGGIITKDIFTFPGGKRFHFTDPDGYELAVWSE